MIEVVIALILAALTVAPSSSKLPKVVSMTPQIISTTLPPSPTDLYFTPTPTPEWGKLIKTGTHTYKIAVGSDPKMTTADELLQAINDLRRRNGAQPLHPDPRLCTYSQQRADSFNKAGDIDAHVGFNDFLENHNGFEVLGFQRLGENSSIGYQLSGVHLVEFVYMKSPDHNKNQLDPAWDHGCAGVSGTATNIIFATSPY